VAVSKMIEKDSWTVTRHLLPAIFGTGQMSLIKVRKKYKQKKKKKNTKTNNTTEYSTLD
jgi:hypothetical protein